MINYLISVIDQLIVISILQMESITIGIHVIPSCLLLIGFYGVFFTNNNLLVIIMALELMLLAISFSFIISTLIWWDLTGQVITLFILTVAAAEAAIGLALIVSFYKLRGEIFVSRIDLIFKK